jgi:putative nucleotidyltransferase with HDIG domain
MAPHRFSSLPVSHRVYLTAIIVAGACTVVLSLIDLGHGLIPKEWLILAVLTAVSGSAPIRLYSIPVALSVSETFVFTSAILFGPSAGTLTVALDAAVISFWSFKRGHKLFKIVFNVFALPLTIWLASQLLFAVGGFEPLFRNKQHSIDLQQLLGPLLLCTVAYFLLSSWIITFAIALERRLPPFKIWRENFAWISLNYFGGASVAALIVSYTNELDWTFFVIILTLLPMLGILYATYSRRVDRVQDANRHLIELNTLYVSTIETLAMAIDAKDQVTHGHIRRVQQYAVGLARHLGVMDQALIQAIEAAALLHDMGKLAVPEYILNKPGPLTPAEFERMKLHASIGADILSSINFPYPVVPIVRHHHENWDGSGYPDGIKATQIPLGARILSVVDCYDALTSDRPYRPRLSNADATRILIERRGTMYDPLIVDTFLRVHEQLSVEPVAARPAGDVELIALASRTVANSVRALPPAGLSDIAASTEEMLVLYDLAQSLLGGLELADAADIISKHLRRIVPASTCVFFLYDIERDELVAAHASGDNAAHFVELRIPRGQRLTGWVAANKQSIVNSDPVLDLGESARHLRPQLKSCLSTPLLSNSQLVGVLSVYSPIIDVFTDDHRRLIEVVARQVSESIRQVRELQPASTQPKDGAHGLPQRERVERFVAAEIDLASSQAHLSIVRLEIAGLANLDSRRGRPVSIVPLEEIIAAAKRVLRGGDVLFRYSDTEFVVVLTQTDSSAATAVANRIAEILAEVRPGLMESARLTFGVASAPTDGGTLADLVVTAAQHRWIPATPSPSRPAIH